jgi:ERCC4-type nuclease
MDVNTTSTVTRSLRIDYRERSLIDAVKERSDDKEDITVVIENLELGDVQITKNYAPPGSNDDGGVTTDFDVIMERKTLADLCASIKDGRYKEQKNRMLGHLASRYGGAERRRNRVVVIYVLENCQSFGDGLREAAVASGLHPTTIQSCVYNLMFRDGVHVIFTKDVRDTAGLVASLWQKRKKLDGSISEIPKPDDEEASFSYKMDATVLAKRNKNVTPVTCYEMMLCQIPGVSGKTAQVFAEKWPSMATLYADLSGLSHEDRVRRILPLPTMGKKNTLKVLAHLFPEGA